MGPKVMVDTIWVLVTAMLVFFMNLGFACVESAFCRSKNTVNILSKNFIVFAASVLSFWFIGFGLMFGNGSDYYGLEGLLFLGGADNSPATGDAYQGVYKAIAWTGVPLEAKFFFQVVFAGTAATIVSGAVAERIKYSSFVIFSFLLVALIYPITGHWIWGGGWLASSGFWDFAGSTQVHSVGGWAALTGAIILGPRVGRYSADGKAHAIPGHNMSLALIGALVLWFGWYGFNPGSTMAADPVAMSHIALTTTLAACTGILGASLAAVFTSGKPDIGMTINGCLAGLVGVTAPCAFVSAPSAAIIGVIAGVLCVYAVSMFDKFKVDDPVGALSVHLVNGIFGTIAVGLFAEDRFTPNTTGNGLFFGGGSKLLMAQLTGVVSVGLFVAIGSAIFWLILKSTWGLRVPLHEEITGLDIGEHGNEAYPDFAPRKARDVLTVDGPKSVPPAPAQLPNYSSSGAPLQKIEAVIRPEMFDSVRAALKDAGLPGLTVTEVEGQGRGAGMPRVWRGSEVAVDLLTHVKVDVITEKDNVNKIVDIIMRHASTGELGDGYVFLSDANGKIEIRR